MRNFKKFLTLVLAVMMVVSAMSFTTSAAATKFEDVNADNEALVEAVELLNYMGVAKGVSDTQFGADQNVTREQFALFMYRLMKGGKDAPKNSSNSTNFTDLADPTYNYAISWAVAEGIVNGKSETSFAPKDGITLQEAYTMVVRALDYEEEEKLIYPHGYIEVAEKLGVELDANLDSKLGYEDTLTRADMAIILYNAFFAETGVAEVKTRERGLGWVIETDASGAPVSGKDGMMGTEDDEYTNYVLEEYTTYPRLCEKSFEVYEVEYEVIATPNFQIKGESDATYELGYPAIYVKATTADINKEVDKLPANAYIEAEDLGLEAAALNDLFLGYVKMFVTLEEKNNVKEIDKVLFFDCDMVEKTVNDLKLETVSTNKPNSYFAGTKAKLLSGKITTGNETIYAFNAPYSYAKPETASNTYAAKNAKNIKTISFVKHEGKDDVVYFEADKGGFLVDALNVEDTVNNYAAAADKLAQELAQVYYEGLYEADLYDVDGDGLYDYMQYKPYGVFVVDSDEDYSFLEEYKGQTAQDLYTNAKEDVGGKKLPLIYTNEATVTGVEFKDEDVVIGYFSPEAGVVHVAAVLKPTTTTVADIDGANYVFADGSKADATADWKMLANFLPGTFVYDVENTDKTNANALTYDVLDEDEKEYYVYDGVVLLGGDVNKNFKLDGNVIIPLDFKKPYGEFDREEGEYVYSIYAWTEENGFGFVDVDVADVHPDVIENLNGETCALNPDFVGMLCDYTVDKNGVYTIKSYMHNEEVDKDGNPLNPAVDAHISTTADLTSKKSEDDGKQLIAKYADVKLVKESSRLKLVEVNNNNANALGNVVMNAGASSKIIVIEKDTKGSKDKYSSKVLTGADITGDMKNAFASVVLVLSNNIASSTRENLVTLVGIMPDNTKFEFEGKEDKDGQRIMAGYKVAIDEEGDYRAYYTVINPFTGAKETNIPGTKTETKASSVKPVYSEGDIITLKNGMVDDDAKEVEGALFTQTGLVYFHSYDATDSTISVTPASVVTNYDNVDCFTALVEESIYDATKPVDNFTVDENGVNEAFVVADKFSTGTLTYEITKDTAITVITKSDLTSLDAGKLVKWGKVSVGDASIFANPKNEYKCFTEEYQKPSDGDGDNYSTKYSKYLKGYVSASQASDEEETPVADYIIIVAIKDADNKQFHSAVASPCTANPKH